jgi:predicted ATPase/DNA-binding winged helix-turn-helix (wHTH) protein
VPKELRAIAFGPFRLFPAHKLLLEGDTPVRIGSRAFDILVALVERAGDLVSKERLLSRAWATTTVDEANLRVHIAAIRRLLGDGQAGVRYIVNESGRGYRFVMPVSITMAPAAAPLPSTATQGADNLPVLLSRTTGRSEVVATLTAQLPQRRCITIVGPGGIGKTTVAVAAAHGLAPSYEHGVRFIDLANLTNSLLVPSAVASLFGIPVRSEDLLADIVAFLRGTKMLLVLDSCERVLESTAALVEAILKGAPGLHILATSRERLGAEGEWVQRLMPLGTPDDAAAMTATAATAFPAVQLFVERVAAGLDGFALSDADAPVVAHICRRLDGLPLAIELAASRVDAIGLSGLARHLNDRFYLEMRGRRTALPRHQTLSATLNWSYEALPDAERTVLRRLGIFAGRFTIEAATAIAGSEFSASDVFACVVNLVAKSLVVADVDGADALYRLLDTTRVYALEKLAASGELESLRRLHAQAQLDLFKRAEAGIAAAPADEWRATYGPAIGDLRSALDWAFSVEGDVTIGIDLAVAATDFWLAMSLFGECRDWGLRAIAIARFDAAEATRDEMVLRCGVGQALTYSKGMNMGARDALARALRLAETLDDRTYQFRALYGLWLFAIRAGDFPESLDLSCRYQALAGSVASPAATATAHCLLGISRFHLGDHRGAAMDLEQPRVAYPTASRTGHVVRFGLDLPVSVLSYQAMVFWLLGFAERAARAVEDAVAEARASKDPGSLCFALAPAGFLLVKIGRLEAAERYIEELIDQSAKYSLVSYSAFGACTKGSYLASRGDIALADKYFQTGLEAARNMGYYLFYAFFLAERAALLASLGRLDEGLAVIDAALRNAEASKSLWCVPEVLRIKGELHARADASSPVAEESFLNSLEWARRQGTLFWELRTATALARLWHDRSRTAEARDLLHRTYERFTEGFETPDLVATRDLLSLLN